MWSKSGGNRTRERRSSSRRRRGGVRGLREVRGLDGGLEGRGEEVVDGEEEGDGIEHYYDVMDRSSSAVSGVLLWARSSEDHGVKRLERVLRADFL